MRSIGQYGGTHYDADEFTYPVDEPATETPHCADARGCHYKVHARGLCRKHYEGWKKANREESEQ